MLIVAAHRNIFWNVSFCSVQSEKRIYDPGKRRVYASWSVDFCFRVSFDIFVVTSSNFWSHPSKATCTSVHLEINWSYKLENSCQDFILEFVVLFIVHACVVSKKKTKRKCRVQYFFWATHEAPIAGERRCTHIYLDFFVHRFKCVVESSAWNFT